MKELSLLTTVGTTRKKKTKKEKQGIFQLNFLFLKFLQSLKGRSLCGRNSCQVHLGGQGYNISAQTEHDLDIMSLLVCFWINASIKATFVLNTPPESSALSSVGVWIELNTLSVSAYQNPGAKISGQRTWYAQLYVRPWMGRPIRFYRNI